MLIMYALGGLLSLICHLLAGALVSISHISSETMGDLFSPARRIWVEYATTTGANQIVQWGSVFILGLPTVAGIRGAVALMGPLNVIYSGMNILYLSQRRMRGRSLAIMVSTIQIGSALLFGLAVLLALHAPTRALLGPVAEDVLSVWPAYILVGVTAGFAFGPLTAMRYERQFGRIAAYRSAESVANASLTVGLCGNFGPATIPVVQAAVNIVTATFAWLFVRSRIPVGKTSQETNEEPLSRIEGADAL
jgi:hypothetical protein